MTADTGRSHGWTMPLTASRPELLSDGGDRDLRRLVYGIFTMTVRFDRIREGMANALGLTGIQYHILMVVAERTPRGPATVSTIAEVLHASGAYVTTETGKLAALGLLEKTPNPADRRSVVLTLTEKGRELIDDFAPTLRAVNDTLFDGLGPETYARFCAIVEHMVGTTGRTLDLIEGLAKETEDEANGRAAAAGLQR